LGLPSQPGAKYLLRELSDVTDLQGIVKKARINSTSTKPKPACRLVWLGY
jgi:hypothetical protein